MASKAQRNVKTFIQPDNLKAFAKTIPGKATTLVTETLPDAFNEGVDTVKDSKKRAAKMDTFQYNHPKWSLLGSVFIFVFWIWLFYYWNPYNFFSCGDSYNLCRYFTTVKEEPLVRTLPLIPIKILVLSMCLLSLLLLFSEFAHALQVSTLHCM